MNIEYSLDFADVKAFSGFCMQQPASKRAKLFRWDRCARETLSIIEGLGPAKQ